MTQKNESTSNHGRKDNQKMKSYLVYDYLLHNSDENHTVSTADILDYLETLGVPAERRSIYRDIDSINKALWILDNKEDYMTYRDIDEENYYETILYDKHTKGFYTNSRKHDATDIRLIAECIYSSKYISQTEAERLVEIMKDFVSNYQKEEIRTDALVNDRTRTLNKNALNNVSLIYDAMSKKLNGEPHTPEKITFHYLKSQISDLSHQVERRQGAKYTVSPWKLIINDGNYYLLAFSDEFQEMRTYRVDRMKDIKRTKVPRDGKEAFQNIDLRTYTQRTFSMFSGNKERVLLRFRNQLLDTALEKFGRTNVSYSKADNYHFTVSADIEISEQFFGWLCGFGEKVVILAPTSVKRDFTEFLDKIRNRYEGQY